MVSTCLGSLCTLLLLAALIVILFAKSLVYAEGDPSTFTLTTGVDYGYYPPSTEFNEH